MKAMDTNINTKRKRNVLGVSHEEYTRFVRTENVWPITPKRSGVWNYTALMHTLIIYVEAVACCESGNQ